LIAVSKLRSCSQEFESFADIKENLHENKLTRDMETCFLTFDPLDEPLLGGLKKNEFMKRIEELLPITGGNELFNVIFSNEEKEKLRDLGMKFEGMIEKSLFDLKDREKVEELIQHLKVLKFLNEIKDEQWERILKKISWNFEEKRKEIIDQININYKEFKVKIGDCYLNLLKGGVDCFGITGQGEIEELELLRLRSWEKKEFLEKVTKELRDLRNKFIDKCQQGNLQEASKILNELQTSYNELSNEIKEKVDVNIDVLKVKFENLKNDLELPEYKENIEVKVQTEEKKEVNKLEENLETQMKNKGNQTKKKSLLGKLIKWGFILLILSVILGLFNELVMKAFNELEKIKKEILIYHTEMKEKSLDDVELKVGMDLSQSFSQKISYFNDSYIEIKKHFQNRIDSEEKLLKNQIQEHIINENKFEILMRSSYLLKNHLRFNSELLNNASLILNPENSSFYISSLENVTQFIEENNDLENLNKLFSSKDDYYQLYYQEQIRAQLSYYVEKTKIDSLNLIDSLLKEEKINVKSTSFEKLNRGLGLMRKLELKLAKNLKKKLNLEEIMDFIENHTNLEYGNYLEKIKPTINNLMQEEKFCEINEILTSNEVFLNLTKGDLLLFEVVQNNFNQYLKAKVEQFSLIDPYEYQNFSPKVFLQRLNCNEGTPFNEEIRKSTKNYNEKIEAKIENLTSEGKLNPDKIILLKMKLIYLPNDLLNFYEPILTAKILYFTKRANNKITEFRRNIDSLTSNGTLKDSIEELKSLDIDKSVRVDIEGALKRELNLTKETIENQDSSKIIEAFHLFRDKMKKNSELYQEFVESFFFNIKAQITTNMKSKYQELYQGLKKLKEISIKTQKSLIFQTEFENKVFENVTLLINLLKLSRQENLLSKENDIILYLDQDFESVLNEITDLMKKIHSSTVFASELSQWNFPYIIQTLNLSKMTSPIFLKMRFFAPEIKNLSLNVIPFIEILETGWSYEKMIDVLNSSFEIDKKLCTDNLVNKETNRLEYHRNEYYQRINATTKKLKKAEILLKTHILTNVSYEYCLNSLDFSLKTILDGIQDLLQKNKLFDENELDALNVNISNIQAFNENLFTVKNLSSILLEIQRELKKMLLENYEIVLKNFTLDNIARTLKIIQKIGVKVFGLKILIEKYIEQILNYFIEQKGYHQLEMLKSFLEDSEQDYVYGRIIIDKQKAFKENSIQIFNRKTQTHGIDYVLEKLEGTDLNLPALKRLFEEFQYQYQDLIKKNLFSEEKLNFLSKKTRNFSSIINYNTKILSNGTNYYENQLISLIAHVFSIWTCELSLSDFFKSQNTADIDFQSYFFQPHPAQVIAIFRSLNLGSNTIKLFNHLAEILSGEGKSVTLAITGTVLALMGFDVDIAIYSDYLSQRDRKAFQKLFQRLEVQEFVRYGTFAELCEEYIHEYYGVREKVKSMFTGGNSQNYKQKEKNRQKIVLLDEVDVFFSPEFLGNVYKPMETLRGKIIEEVLDYIWRNRKNDDLSFRIIKESEEYKRLVRNYDTWEILIENAMKNMIYDLKNWNNHEYIVKNDMIAYKELDNLVFNKAYGYKTKWAYYLENEKGLISSQSLQKQKYIRIVIGSFSYAEIPLKYEYIMGVTGTLKQLTGIEKQLLNEKYSIKNNTFLPSVYGKNDLKFEEKEDVKVFSQNEFYRELLEEIQIKSRKIRPVLVFFDQEKNITDFLNSKEAVPFQSHFQILTEKASNDEREALILSATQSGNVTLLTRSMGRALDFRCYDNRINNEGGIHVIQTFYSKDPSENVQIRRRTARQGDKGSYSMILLEGDLYFDFNLTDNQVKNEEKKVYEILDEKVGEFVMKNLEEKKEKIINASKAHEETLSFVNDLNINSTGNVTNYLIKMNEFNKNQAKTRLHLIVMLDSSGSMKTTDVLPTENLGFEINRFGAVLENLHLGLNAINDKYHDNVYMTYGYFSNNVAIPIKNQQIYKDIVINEQLNSKNFWGGTNFDEALRVGIDLMKEFENDYIVMIFLSDGEANTSQSVLDNLTKMTEEVDSMSFVIGIGEDNAQLRKIAQFSNQGKYQSVKQSIGLKDYLFNEVFDSIGYGSSGFYVGEKK